MDKLWSHLFNAEHIDQVISSLKTHPKIWDTVFTDQTFRRNVYWDAARIAISDEAWDATRATAYNAAYDAVSDATRNVWNVVSDETRHTARHAILALVVYDDAAKYLNMTVDQLKMWAILSKDPAAILLLPAVIAFEQIRELEMV